MQPIRNMSFSLGTWLGLSVRMHWLVPLLLVGILLRLVVAFPERLTTGLGLMAIYLSTLVLHICAHALALLYWRLSPTVAFIDPLGGLVRSEERIPGRMPAGLSTWVALAGPLFHLNLALLAGILLWVLNLPEGGTVLALPWNPFRPPLFETLQSPLVGLLEGWFWIHWVLALLNLFLVGVPSDAGDVLAAWMAPHTGVGEANKIAARTGIWMALLLLIASVADNSIVVLLLALFVVERCWTVLSEESGEGMAESVWEPEEVRLSWWQRRQLAKQQQNLALAQKQQREDEARMDHLLEKIHALGKSSLTRDELEFLRERADRYKNRMA